MTPMVDRRTFLGGMMSTPFGDWDGPRGSGANQPRPMNAPPARELSIGVQPGVPNIIRAKIIIVSGPGGGLFVYAGVPGPGNPPVSSVRAPGGTADPFGNAVTAVMQAGVAGTGLTSIDAAGDILLSGPTGTNVIQLDPTHQRELIYSDPPGAGALGVSLAVANGTDSFGNVIFGGPGVASYSGTHASILVAAALRFSGTSNAPNTTPTVYTIQDTNAGTSLQLSAGKGTVGASPLTLSLYDSLTGNAVSQAVLGRQNNQVAPGTAALLEVQGTAARNLVEAINAGAAETEQAFSFNVANGWLQVAGRQTSQYFLTAAPAATTNSVLIMGSVKVPVGFVANQAITNAAPAAYRPTNFVSLI